MRQTVLSRIELKFENGRSWTINDVLELKIIFQNDYQNERPSE